MNEHAQFEQIKQRFTMRVDVAMARWAHRPANSWSGVGGHAFRSIGAARAEARMKLVKMGFTAKQAGQIINDLYDLVVLERTAIDAE